MHWRLFCLNSSICFRGRLAAQMAAHVPPRTYRRLFAGLALGAGRRRPVARRQFSHYIHDGERYARRFEASVFDRRACGFCRRFGRLFQKNLRKSLAGVSRSASRSGERQSGIPHGCGNFSKHSAPVCGPLCGRRSQTGLLGLVLQAVLVPFIVMGLGVLLGRDAQKK